MSSLALVALAFAQPEHAPPPVQCPAIILSATPDRSVSLSASEVDSWRGPVLELNLAVTAAEAAAFGKLAFIRLGGKAFAGGFLGRPVDERDAISFRLAFEPDQLSLLSKGGPLELVERAGPGLSLMLAPADPAPLAACLAKNAVPPDPRNAAFMARTWTFVPLEANQPLSIRSRGNPDFAYPVKALAEDREGSSRVAVSIGPDGRIDTCQVIVSSGHADLDEASCRAARRSSYWPATDAKGEPVETKAEQNLEWKTEG
jgi:TonB family protein